MESCCEPQESLSGGHGRGQDITQILATSTFTQNLVCFRKAMKLLYFFKFIQHYHHSGVHVWLCPSERWRKWVGLNTAQKVARTWGAASAGAELGGGCLACHHHLFFPSCHWCPNREERRKGKGKGRLLEVKVYNAWYHRCPRLLSRTFSS